MEKLYGEVLCKHYMEDYHMEMRVARLHNIYGPKGAWKGGRYSTTATFDYRHDTRRTTRTTGTTHDTSNVCLLLMDLAQGEGTGGVLPEGDLLAGQL